MKKAKIKINNFNISKDLLEKDKFSEDDFEVINKIMMPHFEVLEYQSVSLEKPENEMSLEEKRQAICNIRFLNFCKIFDCVFNKGNGKMFGKKEYDNNGNPIIKYTFKKYECFLAVYVSSDKVTYSIRLNTVNFHDDLRGIVYWDETKHYWTLRDLYTRMFHDFAYLMLNCQSLTYAPEWRDGLIPYGLPDESGNSWYESLEKHILKPLACDCIPKFITEE